MRPATDLDRPANLRVILILAGVSLVVLAVMLCSRAPGLSISEVMMENDSSYPGREGDYPDWIELRNGTNKPIDLSDMYLSDDQRDLKKWRMADRVIEARAYLVLESSADPAKGFPFGIRPSDKHVILSGKDGRIAQSVSLRKVRPDVSLAWDGMRWTECPHPSPGFPNTDEGYAAYFDSISDYEYSLRVNEYCPSNKDGASDESGERPDWIEVLNYGDSDIDLGGIGLSDSADDPFRWRFPSVVLPAGEYAMVFASGKDIRGGGKWFHAPFRLDERRDSIILSSPQGRLIDRVDIEELPLGAESAGIVDGDRLFFSKATPGMANREGLRACPHSVAMSLRPGFYDDAVSLELSATGGAIRYTIDGSEPGRDSPPYLKALEIRENAVVRARVFEDGCLPGRIASATYFIGEESSLPVFSVSLAPDLLYGEERGLLAFGKQHAGKYPYFGANFWQEWEYPVGVEMFGEDGAEIFAATAGIKVFGSFSRGLPQKSFALHFRGIYGMPRLALRLFPEKEVYGFESLVLRSGGQDSQGSKIRDLVAGKLAGRLGLEYQSGYPVLLFLNGEYYGLCNLREKVNGSFLAANAGRPDKRGIDLLEGNGIILSGSYGRYGKLIRFATEHDLSIAANYERIGRMMDIENYIDYHVLQVYLGNLDSGNIRFWRGDAEEDRWRWIFYDADHAFGDYRIDAFKHWLDPDGRGYAKQVSTLLITKLLENEEFKDLFIERFVRRLDSALSPEIVAGLIREQASLIAPEMPRQIERWGLRSELGWEVSVDRMIDFARRRDEVVLDQLKSRFGLSDSRLMEYRKP